MWYVLQVKTGEELRVKDELKRLGYIAFAPRESRLIRQGGKWIEKEYILFPSYVFVNVAYDADNYYRIKSVVHVIRFLSTGNAPSPLTYLEAEWIKVLGYGDAAIEPSDVIIDDDGNVNIVNGILNNFSNRLIKFDRHKKKATFKLTICGEEKSLNLSVKVLNELEEQET